MVTASVYPDDDDDRAAARFRWIERERAGFDLGEAAVRRWVREHWHDFLRACWLEHLLGRRFHPELDRGDFGLLARAFADDALLLDRIVDRLVAGQENLHVILWAQDWNLPMREVLTILEALDINSRRLNPAASLASIDPAWLAWRDGLVRRLAREIRETAAYDALPVLGDALEEAGCDDPVLLDHCRAAGPHYPRSWLVDFLAWCG